MTSVPFYLQPNVTTTDKANAVDIKKALEWSYDYDYQFAPEPQGTTDFWESVANTGTQVKDAVWSTAKGSWETVKSAGSFVVEGAGNLQESLTDKIFGSIDSLLVRAVIIFAVLIAGLWVLGKSGLVGDAAKIMAFK